MKKRNKKILIPLPNYGFDPTESSVPWMYLNDAGFQTVFATPDGKPAQADIRMLTGKDLGVLKSVLMNDKNGQRAYAKLEKSSEFHHPISYEQIDWNEFDALLLSGGHDKGMREYLGSALLQEKVAGFFDAKKPVAAICHGTLLAGRSTSLKTGRSVLYGRKTTGLTRIQELISYYLTKLYLKDYYRTYPELDHDGKIVTMQDELVSYLESPDDYSKGPGFPIPLGRDKPGNFTNGFTVCDGNYLSARWPGDAHRFGHEFVILLNGE
ncbi:MAG: DJ-1/PfpI family protein [Bacteroidales bacterium]|nr:DJ-1/PfpI family protein [Bacteroidales bacterium]